MMKCNLCKNDINEKAIKCHHCRGWQSITGLISKKMEYGLMSIVFTIMVFPITYFANELVEEKYSSLNFTARFMVLKEYAKETNTDSWGDYRINIFNYYKLKSRYDEIITSIDNKHVSEAYTCLETQGVTCKDIVVIEKDGYVTLTFNNELSVDAIEYISKLSLDRNIVSEYAYGKNKIIIRWT